MCRTEKIIPVMAVDRLHSPTGGEAGGSPEYPVTSSYCFYAIVPCTRGFGTGLVNKPREDEGSGLLWKISHPTWVKTFSRSLVGWRAPTVLK